MKSLLILAFALLTATAPALAQYQEEGMSVNTGPRMILKRVTDSIFLMEGHGGNTGIFIGQQGGIIIDSKLPDTTSALIKRYNGMAPAPLKFVINTHHHGDHTGGNKSFKAQGITIISHKNVRKRLAAEARKSLIEEKKAEVQDRINAMPEAERERAVADITGKGKEEFIGKLEVEDVFPNLVVDHPITIFLNGESIRIFPVQKGHTDGDMLVYFANANVLHTGDAFVQGRYPFIDVESGGSADGYLLVLKQILSLIDDDTKIVPGHGNLSSKKDVQETIRMFESVLEDVTFYAYSGKTLQEVQALKSEITKPYDDKGYGDAFITTDAFLEVLYSGPAQKAKRAKALKNKKD